MSIRLKKILLLLLAAVLLVGVSQVQDDLNQDRDQLGLTRAQPLENAPPVLAFTTVALGGFRGLISNVLWIRANDLQDEDKFFEMAQLAKWITVLEPHFVHVWLVQAWNMAYNISVKFKDFPDRWRWVKKGIELLRDDGLRYNPNEILIYRELAWFFQHKLGANMDDANMYYKQQWANQLAEDVFDKKPPNLQELAHPQNDEQRHRAQILREKYKMDPEFMLEVDKRYGPLEWRLPEAHAIYWAALGLRDAEQNPEKIKPDDLITLRRVIYQSMQISFQRGHMIPNPFLKMFELGPNVDIIPKVSAAYEQAAKEDEKNHDHILRAHKNFLKDAVYFLYVHHRLNDAAYWYDYLGTKYPNDTLLDYQTNSFARNLTLTEYAVSRVQEDVKETSRDRVKANVEGLLFNAYNSFAIGEDESAAGYEELAKQVLTTYTSKTKTRGEALAIAPFEEVKRDVLNRMLDPENGVPQEMRATLRSKLGMEAETNTPAPATNSVPEKLSSK